MKKTALIVLIILVIFTAQTVYADQGNEDGTVTSVSVDTGSLALQKDGSLWVWGDNLQGVKKVLHGIKTATAGYDCGFAIKEDGSLWGWINNTYGGEHTGTIVPNNKQLTPEKIMDGVKAVATCGSYAMAIKEDGSLWIWGEDCGSYLPKKIMDGVKAIAAGVEFSMAVKEDGSLWAWQRMTDGIVKPEKIMDGVKTIAASASGMAVKEDGTLWVWENNEPEDAGNRTPVIKSEPKKIMDGVKAAASAENCSMAIKEDGSLWAWGDNIFGQNEDFKTVSINKPEKIMDGVKAAAAGFNARLAIKEDGSLWSWGNNSFGEFGNSSRPEKITLGKNNVIKLKINSPKMKVNWWEREVDPGNKTAPVIKNGRTLLPIRSLIENMDGTVQWDGKDKKITIKIGAREIQLKVDNNIAYVDGVNKALDVPPRIINGRTMVPLRFIAENLDCDVQWNEDTREITVNYLLLPGN